MHRKLRVVEHFGIASLAVQEQYGTEPRDFYRIFGLEPSRYAPAGGAVPLLVAGTLVGGLGVSVSSPSRTTTSQWLHSGGGARERDSAAPPGPLGAGRRPAGKGVNAFRLRAFSLRD